MILVTMASVIWFLFVEFFVPLEKFSLIWLRHHYQWRAAKFDLCSALMAIELWAFFNVPHPLWYGTSMYNGHIGGPVRVTPTRVAKRCHYQILWLGPACRGWDSNTQTSACETNTLTDSATVVVHGVWYRLVRNMWKNRIREFISCLSIF